MRHLPQALAFRLHNNVVASFLVCAALGLAVPQMAWSQTESPTNQGSTWDANRMISEGNSALKERKILEASRLFEQARVIYTRELGEDHRDTLVSMSNLAITYRALGQYDKALALNEQTLKLRRIKLGEDHLDTLASMNNLAITYNSLGQNDKTLVLYEQILKLQRAKFGEGHPSTLTSMNSLANTYVALGQFDKALALNEQTLKLRRIKLGEDHPDTLVSMDRMAVTYNSSGQSDKALALQERTLQLMRAKLGEDHPNTLGLMSNLAGTYNQLGQFDKAVALGERTLQLMRAKLGEDNPNTPVMMNNLGAFYSSLNEFDKALALAEEVLKLNRAKLGEDHPYTIGAMAGVAVNYSALGQYDKAVVLSEQALKLSRAKLGEDHISTRVYMLTVADTYSALGQYDKALALYEQALKLNRAKVGEDHPSTLRSMNSLAETYNTIGQVDKAIAMIPAIVAGVEKRRISPNLSTEQRQNLFALYSDRYQGYAKWYASARRIGEAFNLGDLSKARTLTDSIKAQAALRSLPSAEQQKLQASEGRAQALQAQIEKLSAQEARDSSAVLALQKQLDTHNTDHLQVVADLTGRYPKYAQLTDLKPATAMQAKQLVGSGEVFVSYHVQAKGKTQGTAQAFVLDASGEAKWVDLGEIKNHAKTVAAYRELISPSTEDGPQGQLVALKDGGYQWLPPGETTPPGATPATARNLLVAGKPAAVAPAPQGASNVADALQVLNRYWHGTLIKPILPVAGPYKRWIISPDKDLALLPFDTLVEAFDATGKPTQTLVQTRNITLVQSFAVFALLKQREAEYATLQRPKELLAMGNAVYGDGWAENRGIRRGVGKRGYATRGGEATDRGYALAPLQANAEQYAMNKFAWQNLPGTAHEIQGVSAVFGDKAKPGGSSVDTYLGLDASEGKLQQLNQDGRLKDYRYLLFSAHGYLAQNPALSSLVLSQQGNPAEIDGYVTASEWPLYDMKSDLTVLSACDTGVGKAQAGESVMGLPYALFVAGNKNTLLSLWPVDDDATAEFMRRFFTHLKAGTSQPDALRKTKQEFKQHPQWSEPRYWAAFVLYGV